MGAGAGFGRMSGGSTGVGSSPTQTDNQQTTAPTGGKGGSIPQGMQQPMQNMMQNPYASTQPQQQQAYRPFGGDAFGYNMARLSRQMDPSATLPAPQQASTFQQPSAYQTQEDISPMGGKGGGMGGYGMFGPQPPQFFGAEPQGQYRTQVEPYNPFDQGFDARTERLNQLERQYQDLIQRAQNQPQDTGEKMADLPEAYENGPDGMNLNIGQSEEETAAETAAAAAAPAPTPPPPPPRTYQEIKTGNKTALQNLLQQNKKEIADLKASGATREAIKAATLANKQEVRTQKQTNKQNLVGVERPQVTNPLMGGAQVPTAAPAPTTGKQQKAPVVSTGLAEQRARNVGAKKGGIIHKGMTNNLKKMLKNK